MKTLDEVIANKVNGLYYGCRIILPVSGTIAKLVIEDDIITDFSTHSKEISVIEKENYSEIYLHHYKNLAEAVNKYEYIKMIFVEKGKDIFDFINHRKIALHIEEHHKIKIEELDKDILFIE